MAEKKWRLETQALHAGHTPDAATLSRAVPVYRTSSYVFKSAEHARNLFALKELGNIYTRLGNPTTDVLEQRVAALEGGVAAVALASGTSAIFYSIINICAQGDEIVSSRNLYGGTFTMFNDILPQFGIQVRFVDPKDPDNFDRAITPHTRALFIESIGNPLLEVADIPAIARVAKKHTLPLIVDSTFTTPALLRPIELGADVVVHSLTKWLGGHGAAIGGVVVDAGRFNWKDKRFAFYNEPDPSYHGIRWGHDLGQLQAACFAIRLRVIPLRNLGACISPDNAWVLLQGIETLSLRMERHCANALIVAQYLEKHPQVSWVRYPGLSKDPSHQVARGILQNGFGGMVVFGIKGGAKAGERFIESLALFSHLANVGDAKSLAIHPASTTHSQLTEDQQRQAGITPELIRLSIGIEHIDDIIADLEGALAAV